MTVTEPGDVARRIDPDYWISRISEHMMMTFGTKTAACLSMLAFLASSAAFAQETPSPEPKDSPPASSDAPQASGDAAQTTSNATQASTDTVKGSDDAASTKTEETMTETEAQARKIIAEMEKAYASCRSYADEGMVKVTFFREKAARTRFLPFSTSFVRSGNRFRFEFKEKEDDESDWGEYIIWGEGTDVRTWWYQRRKVEHKDTLKQALEDASGVAVGSTLKVPLLLLTEQFRGSSLTVLENLEFVRKRKFDETMCDLVRGTHPRGATVTVWIEEKRRIVRKVTEKKHFEDFRAMIMTTYAADFNVKMPPEDLAFDPPEEE